MDFSARFEIQFNGFNEEAMLNNSIEVVEYIVK